MRKIHLEGSEKDNFMKLYQSFGGVKDLEKKYSISRGTVHRIAKDYGMKKRGKRESAKKYNLNEDYFNEVDCQEKAYILGYLYADGNSRQDLCGVSMGLAEQDKYILDEMNGLIENEKPIRFMPSKIANRQNMYKMEWCSKKLVLKLYELGIVPKKSLIIKFPKEEQVPYYLIRHFIRGYFDGDGSIRIRNKCGFISFCGTIEFLSELKLILKKEIDVNLAITQAHKERMKNTYEGRFGGRPSSIKFCNWIYENSSIHLTRKFDKFTELKSIVTNRYRTGSCSLCDRKHASKGYCKYHYHHLIAKHRAKKLESK
jgi:hypothetical protein